MCEKETFAKLAEKTWLNFLLKSDVWCAREQGVKRLGLCALLRGRIITTKMASGLLFWKGQKKWRIL